MEQGHPRVCGAVRRIASSKAQKDMQVTVRLILEMFLRADCQAAAAAAAVAAAEAPAPAPASALAAAAAAAAAAVAVAAAGAAEGDGSALGSDWMDVLLLEAHVRDRTANQEHDQRIVAEMVRAVPRVTSSVH